MKNKFIHNSIPYFNQITIIFLLKIILILAVSCSNKAKAKNYLGNWVTTQGGNFNLKITKSGDNFVIVYGNLPSRYNPNKTLTSYGSLPCFYDKAKDRLIIKADEELDAIYDVNTNQIIIERWGGFSKTN